MNTGAYKFVYCIIIIIVLYNSAHFIFIAKLTFRSEIIVHDLVLAAVLALGIGDIGGCLERHYFKGRQNYEKYNYEKYYYEPLKINLC